MVRVRPAATNLTMESDFPGSVLWVGKPIGFSPEPDQSSSTGPTSGKILSM